MSCASTIRRLAAPAEVLLLLVAMSAAGQAQQASDSGQGSAQAAVAASDQAPRTYIPSLFGQQPIAVDMWQPAVSSNEPAPAVGVVDTSAQDSGAVEPWAPYVRNPAQHYLLYGLNLSATYERDGASAGTPAYSVGLPHVAPYLGFMGHTRTGFYVLQYAPSIVPYDSQSGRSVTFHNFTFDAAGAFTRRLSWNFDTHAGYGGEVGRLTGNLNSQTVVSGVSESGAGYASIQPLTGNSLNASTSYGLAYQLSPRQSVQASVSDTYYSFGYQPVGSTPAPAGVHDNAVGLGLSYNRTLSQTMTLHAYASGARVFSNLPTCDTFGGGVGVTYQPTRNLTADFGAGPSAGCGAQAANYHANLAAALRSHIKAYVGASRQMNTTYRLNSRWEDNLVAGAGKQFGHADLGFDAGYFHGQSLGLGGPSNGYFVSPRINYSLRLSRISGIGFSYRRFHGSAGAGGPPDLSFAMVTLSFSPAPLPLEK